MGSIRPPDPSYGAPLAPHEVPFAVAEAIDALARHRSAAASHESEMHAAFDARVRGLADVGQRPARLGDDGDRARARLEGARSREAADRERAAEDAAKAELRVAVERYARDLRRQGVPPERMIVAVKGVVRRAAAAPHALPEPEHLIPELVQWSVAAYFAAD
ncbi:MAG TPA: hypothetical protein VFZ11_11100 [Gemmatimonadaceae bacterium]